MSNLDKMQGFSLGIYENFLINYPESKAVVTQIFQELGIDGDHCEYENLLLDTITLVINSIRQTNQNPANIDEINVDLIESLISGENIDFDYIIDDAINISRFLNLFEDKANTKAYLFLKLLGVFCAVTAQNYAKKQTSYFTELGNVFSNGILSVQQNMAKFAEKNNETNDYADVLGLADLGENTDSGTDNYEA